ncbi:MAG: hypothetical protein A2287_06215 [Candidatus Melainabacteria bacterium RIFOXYA12_FULL_32_12]|nr:MAG: hypothetical protein A2255_06420 [Candidatus Melainabacteria bacterium RIFOXYA2_FULL_32_9]OGI28204.1 MAG: hypothetical protein A2287_06215 [Candidatus Melainabacteria bacterium RIFOXYA12_FULL_32_12]
MDNLILRKAQQSDIRKIAPYLAEFKLDTENVSAEQFVIAEINGNLAGFGRIKPYENIYELSSIGVVPEYRKKGVGESLIKHLIETCPANEVWISTKIVEYFRKIGFEEVDNVPEEIKQKTLRVCRNFYESVTDSYYMVFKK